MFNVIGILLGKFKVQIILILLAIMAAMVVFHLARVGLLEKALEDSQNRNGTLVIENSALSTANKKAQADIVTQNTAVEKLREDARKQSELAEAAMEKVRKESAAWKGKYEGLFKAGPVGKDDCTNVMSLLDSYQDIRIDEIKELDQ